MKQPQDVPLHGADAAWLHMDDATNPMVVSGLLELAAPLTTERADVLVERFAANPRLRSRVVERALHIGPPMWRLDPDFDPAKHVEHVTLADVGDEALRALAGQIVSKRLDPERPLWHLTVIHRPHAGTVLLYRIHHVIGDAFALLGLLLALCDGAPHVEVPAPTVHAAPTRAEQLVASGQVLERLLALPEDPPTALKRPLGIAKNVAWSAPVSLASIKALGHAMSASVNDVLVALVAGALGRYVARHGGRSHGLELHAIVPVNLRDGASSGSLDNRFGLVFLGLPIGIEDARLRIGAVKQRMDLLKRSPEAFVTRGLLSVAGWAPRAVEDAAVTLFATKASVVLTNVPGPRARLALDGIPITRMSFWVPEAARLGVGVSIMSYAGEVTVSVLADAGTMPDPDTLIGDFHLELAALEAALRAKDA